MITTIIPRYSFDHYECHEILVVAVPNDLKKLGGRCVRINVLKVDSWRGRNVFESDNGVSYEALSGCMFKLSTQPRLDSGISFEQYPAAKKCLGGVDVEVSVKDRIASFGGEIFHILMFTIGEPGEPYCRIPDNCLKLFNKFLWALINNSKIEFCKKDNDFLFPVDKDRALSY